MPVHRGSHPESPLKMNTMHRQAKLPTRAMGLEHLLGKRLYTTLSSPAHFSVLKRSGIQSMPAQLRRWSQVADLRPIQCTSDQ